MPPVVTIAVAMASGRLVRMIDLVREYDRRLNHRDQDALSDMPVSPRDTIGFGSAGVMVGDRCSAK